MQGGPRPAVGDGRMRSTARNLWYRVKRALRHIVEQKDSPESIALGLAVGSRGWRRGLWIGLAALQTAGALASASATAAARRSSSTRESSAG